MKSYKFLNNSFGWLLFAISASVYFLTMEPTVSFWDCGEFIAAAFGMQVGHQPGAPFFIMIGKAFSLLASGPDQVAFWINASSVLSSAATCMFLFWTITALASKLLKENNRELDKQQIFAVFGAGFIGTLAFTFSDTFWFSAVESEVYALSALCTALVFWAILKWEARASEPGADKWLVLIAYIIGLSIGIHLLNLLAIPAIALVYYFRRTATVSLKGSLLTLFTGCLILAFIQYGVIQYLVYFAARFDLFFVNSLQLGFGSGALFFTLLLVTALAVGFIYSHRKNKPALNLVLVSFSFILLGFSSYAMIAIRANAKTATNISNPDNPFSLLEYLGREQYGSTPLLYGNYFDSQLSAYTDGATLYRKGKKRYEPAGKEFKAEYDRNTLFPRSYSQKEGHEQAYRSWMGLGEKEQAGFAGNLRFFSAYQMGFMYVRYFLWNFSGRQNDQQGQGEVQNGNWITGIQSLDALRLGNQSLLPLSITNNEGYNRFFALPFILGLAGFLYHWKKRKMDAGILSLLFFSTGLAIVLVLNMDPKQVRERDYIYVGSFYTFAIWIGIGMLALRQLLSKVSPIMMSTGLSLVIRFAAVPFLMAKEGWNDHNRSDRYTARDMAANYLKSCAPNAILFCLADNDTYPLWYAQQVEGIRKDVRIVNMELLYNDANITQLKKQQFDSAPLPVSMPEEKYAKGTRDVLPFVDYGLADSVELKDVLEVMLSENKSDKVEMQDGSMENFLPTKKLKITIDPKQVLKTATVSSDQADRIADKMEWNYPKARVSKADLAILDILAHNNWNRPIYFTMGLGSSSYFGLNRYLYNEGYAYRLLPLKREEADDRDMSQTLNTNVLTNNVLNNFSYSFNQAHYLDPESRRVAGMTWDIFNNLASELYHTGKPKESLMVMNKAMKVLPLKNYSFTDSLDKYRAAANFYSLKEISAANMLLTDAVSFLNSELSYFISLDESHLRSDQEYLGGVVWLLQKCRVLAVENKQFSVTTQIDGIYNRAEKKLGFSISG